MAQALTAGVGAGLAAATVLLSRVAVSAGWRARALRRLPTPRGAADATPRWAGAPGPLAAALDAAGIGAPPAVVWHGWVGAGGACVATAAVAAGPGAAVLAGIVVAGGPVAVLAAFRDRRDRMVEAALPATLEAVARSLRGGASLLQALDEAAAAVAPASPALAADLAAATAAAAVGAPVEAALRSWAARRPLPGVRLVVASLTLAAATGGAPARAVDGVGATLRSRLAVAGEVRALSSQARASALVIALAPVAFMVLAVSGDPSTASFLFRSPLGLACLTAGIALDGAGALWMHRLTAVDPW